MPAKPSLTETNVPDQTGKVFIVTGATSGIGLELAQILYGKNAKVYISGRSASKADTTIEQLKQRHPRSSGSVSFLRLDLDDLSSIKESAEKFLESESRLDVLWNNAGVMIPPQGSQTKQGLELQLGTNCVAPFLFTKFLTPVLSRTAQTAPAGSTRVVWVSSSAAKGFAPPGGVDMTNLDYHKDQGAWKKYGASKAGDILYAKEFGRRYREDGIVSVAVDPGNLKTDLYRHVPWWQKPIMNLVLKEPIYGAYSELYAGLSPEISIADNGVFVEPWGVKGAARDDIEQASKPRSEGGDDRATEFWEWSEEKVRNYL